MKKILIFLSVLVSLLFAEENSVVKPKEANMLNLLEDATSKIKSKNKLANVYTATVGVDVGADDPQYFDFLTSAYNQAVLQLKANIVLKKAGKVAIEESFKYHHKTIPDEMLNEQLKKEVDAKIAALEAQQDVQGIFGLVNVVINKMLANEKDEKKAKKIEAEATENIFNKAYMEGFVKEGFDEINGLIPSDTFIVTKKNGEIEIGVVGYTTPRSLQLARDLKQGHQSKKTANESSCMKASDLSKSLNEDELLEHFGIKYFYNENCRPSLLAYGMDSFIKEDGMNSDYRTESIERARAMADKFISNFLSSNVNAFIEDKKLAQKTKNAMIKAMKQNDNTNYQNKKTKSLAMIKEMSKELSSSSSMQLIGLEDTRIWNKDMEDYEVVGVIRYYSMDSIKAANEEFNPKIKKDKEIKEIEKKKVEIKQKIQHSSNLDVDDF